MQSDEGFQHRLDHGPALGGDPPSQPGAHTARRGGSTGGWSVRRRDWAVRPRGLHVLTHGLPPACAAASFGLLDLSDYCCVFRVEGNPQAGTRQTSGTCALPSPSASSARPPSPGTSSTTATATISAPHRRRSRTAAAAVPPVARTSSTTRTRRPCSTTASEGTSSVAIPYSRS